MITSFCVLCMFSILILIICLGLILSCILSLTLLLSIFGILITLNFMGISFTKIFQRGMQGAREIVRCSKPFIPAYGELCNNALGMVEGKFYSEIV